MFTYQVDDEISLALPRPKIDGKLLYQLIQESGEELGVWLPWVSKMNDAKDEENFLQLVLEHFIKEVSLNVVILYKHQAAGMISFNRFNQVDNSAEIGYWLGTKFSGKNVVHRAVQAMCSLGFKEYGVNKIEIHAAIDNARSNHVAQKAGFTLDGTIRASELLRDGYHDGNIWTLLKSEWEDGK